MPTRRTRFLAPMACAVAAISLALPSAASANKTSCSYPSTTQVFAQWGDMNQYYLAGDGNMETLAVDKGWTYSKGSSLVEGNEPWFLASKGHTKSLQLAPGATVTSGSFCVSSQLPHARLVAKGSGGVLEANVVVDDGKTKRSFITTLQPEDHVAWAPSRFISLDTSSMAPDTTARATVTLTSVSGEWLVDDFFIDPYAR